MGTQKTAMTLDDAHAGMEAASLVAREAGDRLVAARVALREAQGQHAAIEHYWFDEVSRVGGVMTRDNLARMEQLERAIPALEAVVQAAEGVVATADARLNEARAKVRELYEADSPRTDAEQETRL